MAIQHRLAKSLLTEHPEDAARALELFADADMARILRESSPKVAAEVLRRIVPQRGAAALAHLDPAQGSAILDELDPNAVAGLLRRSTPDDREALLAALSSSQAAAVRKLLRFRENTAGALMDPLVLTIPPELTAKDAISRARKAPDQVRYNVYVVDRNLRLVGVLNIRELFLARGSDAVSKLMTARVHSIRSRADRHAILHHPGWQEVHTLPVVDEGELFVGALRYRVLRRLERELRGLESTGGAPTAEALGDLFGAGVAGLFGAIAPRSNDHGT